MAQIKRNRESSSLTVREFLILGLGILLGVVATIIIQGGGVGGESYIATCIVEKTADIGVVKTDSSIPSSQTKNVAQTTTSVSTSASATTVAGGKPLAKHLPPGFGTIYAYYGKFDHLTKDIPTDWWLQTSDDPEHHHHDRKWFAQHGQDVAVAKFFNFKKNGFFVDLAANHAVWASNTFSLEQNFDWAGICIEPNPIYWYGLSFRKCQVVGSIVGGKDNVDVTVNLGESHHGPYGGIVGNNFDNKKGGKSSQQRYTASLVKILEMFDAPKMIDYLSLDVEGAEAYIMSEFPFDQYTFLCLSIERPKDELKELLQKNGYKHVLDFKRGDTLWAHESVYEKGKGYAVTNPQDIHDHQVKSPMPGYGA